MFQQQREAKEEEERGIVALAWAVGVVAMPIMSPWIVIKNFKIKSTTLNHFINVIAADEFSYNHK